MARLTKTHAPATGETVAIDPDNPPIKRGGTGRTSLNEDVGTAETEGRGDVLGLNLDFLVFDISFLLS